MKRIVLVIFGILALQLQLFACTYTLVMDDSWGDGWDGAYIDVYINGSLSGTYTVGAGFSSSTITLTVNQGDNLQLYYTAGSYESEHTWNLYNSGSTLLAGGGPTPATGLVYSASVDCGSTGPATAGDCSSALTVCTDLGFQIDAAGSGSINEIPSSGSYGNPLNNNPGGSGNWGCLQIGESNSTWMIINIGNTGTLEFNFGGSSQAGYYDWIMYPYNANSCSDIPNNLVAPVRCNWNATSTGGTGLSGNPGAIGGDPGNFEPPLSVTCGDQYIICFSNYSSALTNVPLVFSGTASVACDLTCAGNSPCTVTPGDPTYSDCINAIPVCQSYYCQEFSFTGEGSITGEINSTTSCLGSGEKNDVWYTFTVQQGGDLNFTITPSNTADDYDWAVYNLSSSPCSDIATNAGLEVSCNYSANIGCGGLTGPNGETVDCPNQNEPVIPVQTGETYVVNVSNYSSTSSGYALDFAGSTAVIFDNIPPAIDHLNTLPGCGATSFEFQFTENVLCSSVQDCDFQLTGPGGPYTLSGVSGEACTLGGTNEDVFTINVSPPITATGNFSLDLVAGCGFVEDLCGNVAPPGSLPFTIVGLTSTMASTNPQCNGACTGTATVTASGGSTPYTYLWSNGATGASATGLCAGTYTVTITDAGGCDNINTVTITQPPAMTISLTSTPETCGQGDGTIAATVTGGTAPYDYASSPAVSNALNQGASYTFTGMASANYTVTVTDNSGCTITGTSNVGNTGSVTASFNYSGNQCYNAAGNTVTFTNTSTGTTTYAWDFGDGGTSTLASPSHNYTAPGAYTVTLTASQGACVDVQTVNLTIYDLPTLAFTPANVTCAGFCDGSILVTPSAGGANGSSIFTGFSWSNGQSAATATNLCAGTYTVTVEDNIGCTATGSSSITAPPAVSVSPATVDNSCFGACNGSAQVVSVSGGIGPFSYLWSNGQTTQNISGLCAGTYTVTVSDNASSGCTLTEVYNVTQPPQVTLSTSSTNSNCGLSDGTATVTVSNGTADFTYDWLWATGSNSITSSSNTNTLNTIPSGTINVTVTDADGCSATAAINVSDNAGPTSSVTNSVNILCNGQCTGSMTVTVSGGTSPYTYNWDGAGAGAQTASTVETLSSLCAGSHSVVITDNSGCITSSNVTLTQPSLLTATAVGTNQNCSVLGSATVFPSGGTAAGSYGYSWSGGTPPLNLATVNGLSAGTYTVTVTDDNSCSTTTTVSITDIGGMSAVITGSTQPSCFGGSNATATVSVSGGTANYTYTWVSGSPVASSLSTNTGSGLSAQSYEVSVTDANGCAATATVTITEPPAISSSITNTVNATCNGSTNGSLTVTPSGGTMPYYYLWNPGAAGQTSATASSLQAGTYTVTVSDANGCTTTASGTVAQPAVMTASAAGVTAHCGQSDGSAYVVSAAGGNPGSYSYAWSGGSVPTNQDTVHGLISGTYTVTVTDVLGCTITASAFVPDAPAGIASIASFLDVTCFGASNGQASISYSGPMPFTYLWTNGQTTQTATGLSGGTYTATVTDGNLCTGSATVTIDEPAALTLAMPSFEPDCFGGINGGIGANVTGGTTPYSFLWSNGSTSQYPTGPSGLYCVTVTDANLCTISGCDSIDSPAPLTVTSTVFDASCNQDDGSVYITPAGGSGSLDIIWSNGGTTDSIVNVVAGTYNVTITDQKGCSISSSYVVNNIAGPTITIASSSNVTCNGLNNGNATASSTGGSPPYTYSWSNNTSNAIAVNLVAGVYTVTVADTNLCEASISVTITQPPALGANMNSMEPSCHDATDGWAVVTPFGGTPPYSYQWTGGGTNPFDSLNQGLGDGSYSVLVTDLVGCNSLHNVILNEPDLIVMAIGSTDATCSNSGDGMAFVYNITGGTPHPTNGYYYEWGANASGQLTDTAYSLNSGNYCVTVSDANGCQQSSCINVNTPSSLSFQNISYNDIACYGMSTGTISVSVAGGTPGYGFNWVDEDLVFIGGSQSLSGLDAGIYHLTVTDLNGCQLYTDVVISQPPPLEVSVANDTVNCYGMCNAQLTVNTVGYSIGQPPYSYIWSNIQTGQTATGLCAGAYQVTVIDENDCEAYASAMIYEPPLLQIADVDITNATCGDADGCAEIIFNGGTVGYVFTWNFPGGDSYKECGLAAGTYSVTVSDQNGCSTDTVINVNNLSGPTINSIAHTNVSCFGFSDGTATVSYSGSVPDAGPYSVTWTNGQTGVDATGLGGQTYSVHVVDTNGCMVSQSVSIAEPGLLQSLINSTTDANCYGACNGSATVAVNGGTGPYTYLWSSGSTSSMATSLCATSYNVIVTDNNGCTTGTTAYIDQPAQLSMIAILEDATCYGANNGSITIYPFGGSGGYDYTYPQVPAVGNSATASPLAPGTYSVILSDQNAVGCFIDSAFAISQPDPIEAYISTTLTTCDLANGTATIDSVTGGSGMFDFIWSPPNTYPVATGLEYGLNYLLQVFDVTDNNCSISEYVSVGRAVPPSILAQSTTNPSCFGYYDGTASVRARDGRLPYSYHWEDNVGNVVAGDTDTIAYNLTGGYYHVTVTDADGCTTSTSFLIYNPQPVNVIGTGSQTICNGQFAIISAAANGGTFPWHYTWSNPEITDSLQVQMVYPETTTTYMVSAVDANGCPSMTPAVIVVDVLPPIDVYVSASPGSVCAGDSSRLTAFASGGTGTYTYFWSNGGLGDATTVTPLYDSTYYYVTVYDENFCSAPDSDSDMVRVWDAPDLDMVASELAGCSPVYVQFTNDIQQSGVSYEWNFGDASSGTYNTSYLQSTSHLFENPGQYDVTLTVTSSEHGCSNEYTYNNMITVFQNPNAEFQAFPEETSLFDAEIEFVDLSSYATSYIWDFGDGTYNYVDPNPVHIYNRPDTFTVFLQVRTPEGCFDTVSHNIIIRPEITFYAPSAFLPRETETSDENAYFTPEMNGYKVCDNCYELTIYDRWGEVIFRTQEYFWETMNNTDRWNGRYLNKGQLVQIGVYTWLVKVTDITDFNHEYSGTVTVIR